jgi:hypothetical protein
MPKAVVGQASHDLRLEKTGPASASGWQASVRAEQLAQETWLPKRHPQHRFYLNALMAAGARDRSRRQNDRPQLRKR